MPPRARPPRAALGSCSRTGAKAERSGKALFRRGRGTRPGFTPRQPGPMVRPAMKFPRLRSRPDLDIIKDETVWSGRFQLDVVTFRQRRFDGKMSGERTWELYRRGRAGGLLPYDPWTDQVVLMEQFRLPALAAGVDPVMVEIPAGLCDDGEEPAATVTREVKEEL